MSKFKVEEKVSYHGMEGVVMEVRDSKYVVLFPEVDGGLVLTPYESELTKVEPTNT